MLSGYEAEVGCEMTSAVEALRVGADVTDQCGCCEQANAGNLGKTLTGVAELVPSRATLQTPVGNALVERISALFPTAGVRPSPAIRRECIHRLQRVDSGLGVRS
jgi:hypothetical protein